MTARPGRGFFYTQGPCLSNVLASRVNQLQSLAQVLSSVFNVFQSQCDQCLLNSLYSCQIVSVERRNLLSHHDGLLHFIGIFDLVLIFD